jgi:hypothetical protein
MDFAATADVFLTNTARLSIRYSRESVAQYSSHRAVFATGGTLAAGVAYAK